MRHVDALSREILVCHTTVTQQIKSAQEEDRFLKTLKVILKDRDYDGYILKNDLVYKVYKGDELLVIPATMEDEVIQNMHEQGHAVRKTEDLLMKHYFIIDRKQKIEQVIRNCIPCILAERKAGKQEVCLNPIDKEDKPLLTYTTWIT